MMQRLLVAAREIDPMLNVVACEEHNGVTIQFGDPLRKWIWFDYVPRGAKEGTALKVCFLGRHQHGGLSPIEGAYPIFPIGMYDPTQRGGKRFRLKLLGPADVDFLLGESVLQTSFARLE